MLIGQYDAKVAEKQQVAFPKKFREILGMKLVITKGFDGHLVIVSEENWEALLEGTENKPFIDKDTRETQRFLLGNATFVELDAKGRFIIPEYLRLFANIQKDVVFAGIKRFVELWDKEAWEKHQALLSKNIVSITQRLTEMEKRG